MKEIFHIGMDVANVSMLINPSDFLVSKKGEILSNLQQNLHFVLWP